MRRKIPLKMVPHCTKCHALLVQMGLCKWVVLYSKHHKVNGLGSTWRKCLGNISGSMYWRWCLVGFEIITFQYPAELLTTKQPYKYRINDIYTYKCKNYYKINRSKSFKAFYIQPSIFFCYIIDRTPPQASFHTIVILQPFR